MTKRDTEIPVRPRDLIAGKYRVERLIGEGGMGVVVSARHVELGQRVAIKIMLTRRGQDSSLAERFGREARAAAKLTSQHTAKVTDVGRLPSGAMYMVMEYLQGQDLDDLLKTRGPLPFAEAVDYVLQACEAIAEAHANGIVHRDLKPKNIFLARTTSGKPLIKVLDFGLAKTSPHPVERGLTRSQEVFGSPNYMSPEQLRAAREVDARSDIWALGVTLYELVTGHVPFDAPDVAQIYALVLTARAAPPSQLVPRLPPELEKAVLRCLEPEPEKRFQSIHELAQALETFAPNGAEYVLAIANAAHTRARAPDDSTTLNLARAGEDEPRSLAAWDSGDRTSARRVGGALAGVVGALVLVGLLLLAYRGRPIAEPSSHAGASVAPPAPPESPIPPRPAVDPAPTPPPASAAPPTVDVTALPIVAAAPPTGALVPTAPPPPVAKRPVAPPAPAPPPPSTPPHAPGGGQFEKP